MIKNFELFTEGKKKKPEKQAIEDKYKEYIDKIEDKRKELHKINDSDENNDIKSEKATIKRIEIQMAEKELDIVKLRDAKLRHKRLLRIAEHKQKQRKPLKKK